MRDLTASAKPRKLSATDAADAPGAGGAVYPNHTAIIHGAQRIGYAELYARSRRLARRWPAAASARATPCP